MGRTAYKGYDLPDGAAVPDVPADLRTLVDGGPIPRFANAAARDAAITTPVAGQTVYLNDTAQLSEYRFGGWGKPWGDSWGYISTTVVSQSLGNTGSGTVPNTGFTLPHANRKVLLLATVSVIQNNYTATTQFITLNLQLGATILDTNMAGGGGTGFGDSAVIALQGAVTNPVAGGAGNITFGATGFAFDVRRGTITAIDVGPG